MVTNSASLGHYHNMKAQMPMLWRAPWRKHVAIERLLSERRFKLHAELLAVGIGEVEPARRPRRRSPGELRAPRQGEDPVAGERDGERGSEIEGVAGKAVEPQSVEQRPVTRFEPDKNAFDGLFLGCIDLRGQRRRKVD